MRWQVVLHNPLIDFFEFLNPLLVHAAPVCHQFIVGLSGFRVTDGHTGLGLAGVSCRCVREMVEWGPT